MEHVNMSTTPEPANNPLSVPVREPLQKPERKSPIKRPAKSPAPRAVLPATRPYLIDTLIPEYEVHLVGGPSGAGKTRWLFQMLQQWQKGESVFGFRSHPAEYVYVATDRSYASVCETLRGLGLNPETVPILQALDLESAPGYSIPWLFKLLRERHPKAKLVIIEAIATFVPGGKSNDYHAVGKFLRELSRLCRKNKITIIGVHHTAKEKEKQAYTADREKLLGSGGWSAFAETLFVITPVKSQDPKSPFRRIVILPRNGAGTVVNFKFNEAGRLIQLSNEEAVLAGATKEHRKPANEVLRDFFTALQSTKRTSFELYEALAATSNACSRRTAINRLKEFCDGGVLKKTAHGTYEISGQIATAGFEGTLL
jgi:hypothetical protein